MSKMKRKIKLSLALLGCSLFALAGIYASDTNGAALANATELTTASEILEQYDLGQDFSIPNATISYNGTNYEATSAFLYFPNGTLYTSETLTLNVLGEYTLEYQAVIAGEKVSASKTFKVNSSAYALGTNSVLEYSDLAIASNLAFTSSILETCIAFSLLLESFNRLFSKVATASPCTSLPRTPIA